MALLTTPVPGHMTVKDTLSVANPSRVWGRGTAVSPPGRVTRQRSPRAPRGLSEAYRT